MCCKRCGGEFFDSDDVEYYKDLPVCSDCLMWFEEHDGVDGKLVIDKCGECGHLRGWNFEVYKKRGRPKGSKNKVVVPSVTMDTFVKDGE